MESFFENPSDFAGKAAYTLYLMDSAMQLVDPTDRQAKLSNLLAGFFPKPARPTSIWVLSFAKQAQDNTEQELIRKFRTSLFRMGRAYFQDRVYDLPDFHTEFMEVLGGDDDKVVRIRQLANAHATALAILNRLPFDVHTSQADCIDLPRDDKLCRIRGVYRYEKAVRHLLRFVDYLELRRDANQRLADINQAEGEVRAAKLAAELERYARTICWMTTLDVDSFDQISVFLRDNGPSVEKEQLFQDMKRLQALQDQMPSMAFLELVPVVQPQPSEWYVREEPVYCVVCSGKVLVGVEFCSTCVHNFCHYHCWRQAAWEELRRVEHLTKDTPLPCFMCRNPAPLGDHNIVAHLPSQ